jgi:hypothetical protein
MPLFRRDENEDDERDTEPVPTGDDGRDRGRISFAEAHVVDDDPHGTIKRAIDVEAGVVIYAYKNGNAGGVTAVPISETNITLDGE